MWILCLAFVGTNNKTNLYVFACLHNAFSSPIWPGGYNWTNQYIVVSGIVFVVMTIGSGLANFIFNWIAGWLFTHRSGGDVIYVLMSCAFLTCVVIVVMQIVASKHGVRFNAGNANNDTKDEGNDKEEDKEKFYNNEAYSQHGERPSVETTKL